MAIRVDGAQVRALDGELHRELVGQTVRIVVRDTTTAFPIQNGAGDPIAGSDVVVLGTYELARFWFVSEDPSDLYLDWLDVASGARGPVDFDVVLRDAAMASAASSDASATSSAASAESAATAAAEVAALRGWVEKGVTTRNLFPNPSVEVDTTGFVNDGFAAFSRDTFASGAVSGVAWLRLAVGSSPVNVFTQAYQGMDLVAQPGRWVAVAIMVRESTDVGYVRVRLRCLNADASVSVYTSGAFMQVGSTHTRLVISAQIPTGADRVYAYVQASGSNTTSAIPLADGVLGTDAWIGAEGATQAEAVAAVASFFDGDTPSTNLVGYGWEGAANASVSRRIDMRLVRSVKVAGVDKFPDANGSVDLGILGGGTMDHGQLSGLADDDHPQYLTQNRGDSRYYTKAQVNDLIAAAIEIAYERARQRQYHTGLQGIGSVDGLSSALAARPQWQDVETGNEPRPTGSDRVFWVRGATQPVNIGPYDLHLQGASVTPGDTEDPTAPGTPTPSGVAATSLTLSWTAATDNVGVTGYRVRVNGSTVLPTMAGLSRLITGLTASTEYTFEVAARDANDNWGPYSPPSAPVTTAASSDTEDPSIPDNLVSSSITAAGFMVSWDASTDNVGVTGYRVLLNGVQYGSIVTDTSVVVTGRTAGTLYGVTVQATDAAGNWSDPSDELPVTTSAGGSLPTHSVFTTPPAALVKTVEASPYEHATGFYTYGAPATNGWKVKGARLYIPAGISVPTSCEVNLYVPASGSAPVLGTPTKTATMSGITSGAWNSVNFPSVEPIDPAEFFWISIKFADGTWLGISTFSDGFVTAADGSKLALSDRELGGGIVRNYRRIGTGSTVALTGGTERDVWFGMDAIVEEA